MAFARAAQRRGAADECARAALPPGAPEARVHAARPARRRPVHVALHSIANAADTGATGDELSGSRASALSTAAFCEQLGAPVEMRVARPDELASGHLNRRRALHFSVLDERRVFNAERRERAAAVPAAVAPAAQSESRQRRERIVSAAQHLRDVQRGRGAPHQSHTEGEPISEAKARCTQIYSEPSPALLQRRDESRREPEPEP